MQRYNIFYLVHKGLRELLYQTAGLAQQTDFTNAGDTALLTAQIGEMLDLFEQHAHTENNYILAAIVNAEPTAAQDFEEEHAQDHQLGNRLRALINMFHHAVLTEEKTELGSAIRLALSQFLVFNIEHMAKEELVLNSLLWQYYTDEQLLAITQKMVAGLPKELSLLYNKWMMRALSNNEIIGWMNRLKDIAPAPAFENMLVLAEQELPGRRWTSVKEILRHSSKVA